MKTLGILGGMGPLATAYFYKDIVTNTKATKDWEHIRVFIDSNVNIPSRTRALLYNEESPTRAMKEACLDLMSIGCDVIAVPCNSAHAFFKEVTEGNEIPWVNMIEIVARHLTNFKNVLILGGYSTITRKLYDDFLDNTVYLDDNKIVYDIIEDIKLNNINYNNIDDLFILINTLDIDSVLLGCTELPIVFEAKLRDNLFYEVLDGNELYIKELIKMCGGEIKDE